MSTEFDRRESAKWSQAANKVMSELEAGVDKVFAEDAGRGFAVPTGATLQDILNAGQGAKIQLVEADGQIYAEQRETYFQIDEFALKVLVRLAKLAMEAYREQIFNALSLEQSQAQATIERQGAEVTRLNAETEFRQVGIIRAKAEVEQSINLYRQQLLEAQELSLGAEGLLIQAQLETAEKKLEIIDSIYKVLAAEKLVLVAEQRRAVSLQKVLEAKQILAEIKKEMVPFYEEKATARSALADAITQEIPITEAMIRLGYDRLDLKTTEEYAGHLEREAQEELEMAREAEVRADMGLRLARAQTHRTLQEYSNEIRAAILSQKKELEELGIVFKLRTALARQGIGIGNEIAITSHEISNLTTELINLLNNMELQAQSHAGAIAASAHQVIASATTDIATIKKIVKG